MATFSHLGHCVADLDRAVRFYVDLLGFEPYADLRPPDASSARLMRLGTPLGLHAVYLRRDGLLLELLHYEDLGARPVRERPLDEPGLTHISISCDIAETLPLVERYGGEVVTGTDIGAAIFVRDPDGQLVELLPLAYADHVATL